MNQQSNEPPWYVAGLAFECLACGRCCAGPEEGYVWATDEEIAAMAEHLRLAESTFRKRYVRRVGKRQSLIEKKPSKDCIFLADGRCDIYEVRPTQCRTWPFWSSNLETPEDWSLAGLRCPGINRGSLVSLDEIESRRRATRE